MSEPRPRAQRLWGRKRVCAVWMPFIDLKARHCLVATPQYQAELESRRSFPVSLRDRMRADAMAAVLFEVEACTTAATAADNTRRLATPSARA
jgi:hypothetical protein